MADSPMFRTRMTPVPPRAQPVTRKDVNADWSLDDASLLVYNSDATKRKILNVLGVLVGEEYFEPEFGSMLPFRLFEGVKRKTAYDIEGDSIRAIRAQMADEIVLDWPNCRVVETEDREGYAITLVYAEIDKGPVEPWSFEIRKSALGYTIRTL